MIGVYIRVSSHSQKSESQHAEIRRWLTAHGHDLETVQWFEDTETGATLTRSGLIRLQEAIFAGTVKMVVVWKLDRIARLMREGINTLSRWGSVANFAQEVMTGAVAPVCVEIKQRGRRTVRPQCGPRLRPRPSAVSS